MRMNITACSSCKRMPRVIQGPRPEGHAQLPGSIYVCSGCGHVRVFTDDWGLRELSGPGELLVLEQPEVIAVRKRIDLRPEFQAWCRERHIAGPTPYTWDLFLAEYRAPALQKGGN